MLDYRNCTLCPRKCGVNRTAGQLGFCKMPAQPRLAKAMLHYGEEPILAGNGGAGAVFFSGCTLQCRYCQNAEISFYGKGKDISPLRLREIFEELIEQGAECIDLVTPTHFLPDIIPALMPRLPVPVIYNCGGYERVETLRALEGLVDIYLPDLKYTDSVLSKQLSSAEDYFTVAAEALQEMYRQVGPCIYNDDGNLRRGMVIRHLVLPGYLDNTLSVIDWISDSFPKNSVALSLMSQYFPTSELSAPLNRTITQEEYDGAVSWMGFCGIENGFIQEPDAATTEYLPTFDFQGI